MRRLFFSVYLLGILSICSCSKAFQSPNLSHFETILESALIKERQHTAGKWEVGGSVLGGENANDVCLESLSSMVNNFTSNPLLKNMLLYSGKGINQFGDQVKCSESNISHYIILIAHQGLLRICLGLCIPRQCPADYFTFLNPAVVKVINDQGLSISEHDVQWLQFQKYNDDLRKVTGGYVVTILILCVLALLFLIATIKHIFNWYKSQEILRGNRENIQSVPPRTKCSKFLCCFDGVENINKILHGANKVDKNLDVLNGVRVLSIGWVVLGHGYLAISLCPIYDLKEYLSYMVQDFGHVIIQNANLSVDTFFFISGFLNSMGLCTLFMNKSRYVSKILLAYLHRYIRLFPYNVLVILLSTYIVPTFSSTIGSLEAGNQRMYCERGWWMNLLYIQNLFYGSDYECAGWTWYLANDMQFFILTPFLVIIYCKHKLLGILSLALLAFTSWMLTIGLFLYYNLSPALLAPTATVTNIQYYVRPYTRINVYLLGILSAYCYLAYKKGDTFSYKCFDAINLRIIHSRAWRYLSYSLGLLFTYLAVIWINPYEQNFGQDTNTFENIIFFLFDKILFIFGLILVLYPIFLGRGKILLIFLGHPIFGGMGKLTYGVYMLHVYLYYFVFFNIRNGFFYSEPTLIYFAIASFFLAYFFSLLFTLLIESPVILIEKIYLFPPRKEESLTKVKERELLDVDVRKYDILEEEEDSLLNHSIGDVKSETNNE